MMRLLRPSLFAALCVLATAGFPASSKLPPGAMRVQRAEIIDRKGFERPLVAATMLVPAGWRHAGEVQWKIGAQCMSPYSLTLRAHSPDGASVIELLPGDGWGMNSFGGPTGGCPAGTFRNAQEYLRAWVQRHRPGAQWFDYRVRPERSRAGIEQKMAGGFFRSWIETGQALIGYPLNGRDMRETLAVAISFSESQFSGIGGATMRTLNGQSLRVLGWRAPEGELDFRQFDALWQTLRREDEWHARISKAESQMARENSETQARISQIQGQMSRDTMAEIAKRGQIMAQTRADIAAIQDRTYRERDATSDRMQRDTIKTVREIETYREPRTGSVIELPNHYRHAWRLQDGSYLLTDSQAFEPQRDLGIAGERLQVVK